MEPLIIQRSRSFTILMLIISLGFVGACILMLIAPLHATDQRWTAWTGILFFGAGMVVFVRQLIDSRPRLVIDDHGILDRTLGVGVIPWSEIIDARVRSLNGNDFICLSVRTPEMWLHKYSPVQRAMVQANLALGFSELNVNLAGMAANTAQVHELILKFSAAQRDSKA